MNVATGTLLLLMATQNHISTGSHIGPVIWQGVMMVLMIPFGGLGLWAYTREPSRAYDDKTSKSKRRCRFIWLTCLWTYLLIGVVLFVILIRSGI